jgi:hypothetical protein
MKRFMTVAAVLVTGVLAVAGCAADGGTGTAITASPTPTASPTLTASPATTTVACNGTPLILGKGFPEVQGTSGNVELWGLIFGPVPMPHGKEQKIVWRMTGEGPLEIKATLPDGTSAKRVWLEEHGGSSWQRPGYEWGTGFVFPKRGCWKVELKRTRGEGHFWLPVK